MEPIFVIFIILYLVIYLSAKKKAQKKEEDQKRAAGDPRYTASSRPQQSPYYRAGNPNYRAGNSGYQTANSASYRSGQSGYQPSSSGYSIDASHYHREGYDFGTCFSFKDVPQGADELSCLIAANARHERELQKLLHTREE